MDESYDSDPNQGGVVFHTMGDQYVPKAYVVGGFFSDEITWGEIEGNWLTENKRAGVQRYHASQLNAREDEFKGWKKDQQIGAFFLPATDV